MQVPLAALAPVMHISVCVATAIWRSELVSGVFIKHEAFSVSTCRYQQCILLGLHLSWEEARVHGRYTAALS